MTDDELRSSVPPLDPSNSPNASNSSNGDSGVLPLSRRWDNTIKLFRERKGHPQAADYRGSGCIAGVEYGAEAWDNGGSMRIELNPRRKVQPAPRPTLRDRILTLVGKYPKARVWSVRDLQQRLNVLAQTLKDELTLMGNKDDSTFKDEIILLPAARIDALSFRLTTWADRFERLGAAVSAAAEPAAFAFMVETSGMFDCNIAPPQPPPRPPTPKVSWRK